MRKMTGLLPTLLSVLLVSAPLSTSACDLSCWLHQTGSGCHSVSSATEDNQRTPASSKMDMSSEAETSSQGAQCNEDPVRHANPGARHHSMSAQMNMVRGSLQATPGSYDVSSSPTRPCRATSPNPSLPMYRASTSRTLLVTRW